MVALDTSRSPAPVLVYRAINSVYALVAELQAWNDARVTRKALSCLSARELEDIGLTQGDIDEIVNRGPRR